MQITRSSAAYDVADSGFIYHSDRIPDTHIHVACDRSFGFDIAFRFESSDAGDFALNQTAENGTIIFTCTNFNANMPLGTTRPVELALYKHKKILIVFWVYPLPGDSMRKIEYCIYMEK